MLSPQLQLPLGKNEFQEIEIVPQPEGYRAIAYSTVGEYTLVAWEITRDGESIAGENLWRGNKAIATSGGKLQLITITTGDIKRNKSVDTSDIWESISDREIEIPSQVAIALREVKNIRWL